MPRRPSSAARSGFRVVLVEKEARLGGYAARLHRQFPKNPPYATPEPLDNLRRSDTTALPYLAPALERFLQEYPSTVDGLSRSERRLLRLAEPAPIDLRAAFPRMHEDERAYYITDSALLALASALSRTSPPLITTAGDANAGRTTLRGTVTLTDGGRDVLAGRRDRVSCGLDRWLGGVHLQSGAAIWRWDEERRRMTHTHPGTAG